jgi:hypothetical protein
MPGVSIQFFDDNGGVYVLLRASGQSLEPNRCGRSEILKREDITRYYCDYDLPIVLLSACA